MRKTVIEIGSKYGNKFGGRGETMKVISLKEYEKWNRLTEKKKKEIINELWPFLHGHEVSIDITPLHLIALFEYNEEKLKEISELILNDLWQDLDDVSRAVEEIKKTKLQETCEKLKDSFEGDEVPDLRD